MMVTDDNQAGAPALVARFRVEGSASNPDERDDSRREAIADYMATPDALRHIACMHRRGLWVEVFEVQTGELRAGPIDPDRPLPRLFLGR